MPRLSATSNPTDLREIDRKDVTLSRARENGKDVFQIKSLQLSKYSLDEASPVTLIARAGNTSRRFELGTIGSPSLGSFELDGLDLSKPLIFRLLVKEKSSPRLVASAERLRCAGDGDVESVLPIVCVDLGQRIWRLDINDDGPVLLCNVRIFTSGSSADTYVPFCSLVLPEALRQVLEHIAKDPGKLDEDRSPWADWEGWMRKFGIEVPPPADEELKREWVEDSTVRFCDHYKFTDWLQSDMGKEELE